MLTGAIAPKDMETTLPFFREHLREDVQRKIIS